MVSSVYDVFHLHTWHSSQTIVLNLGVKEIHGNLYILVSSVIGVLQYGLDSIRKRFDFYKYLEVIAGNCHIPVVVSRYMTMNFLW